MQIISYEQGLKEQQEYRYKVARDLLVRIGHKDSPYLKDMIDCNSVLRLECEVQNKSSVRFHVTYNEHNIFNTETRLALQDSFMVCSMDFFMLYNRPDKTPTDELLTQKINSKNVDAKSIFNGTVDVVIDKKIIARKIAIMRSTIPIMPYIVLGGCRYNEIIATFPKGIYRIQQDSRIVLIMRGVLLINTSAVR